MPEIFHVREARFPEDAQAILRFIMELQRFEHRIEPDRRTDPEVAEEFCAVLMARVAAKNGRHFIAEGGTGEPLGWATAHESENEVYVAAGERVFGSISELYVSDAARGRGIGRALIGACEDWARERGLNLIMIGALSGNAAAFGAYRSAGFVPYTTELRKYLK